jgi:hypothetical protein
MQILNDFDLNAALLKFALILTQGFQVYVDN